MRDFLGAFRLDGRTAIVTGGGNGIGAATAHALAQAGATVVVADIEAEDARRVASEIGRGEAATVDVADEAGVRDLVADIIRRHGRIDVLVNNAGIGARMPTVDLPTERWDRVMAVGISGSFFFAREAGRHAGRGTGCRRQRRVDHGARRRRPLPEHRLPQRQGSARQLYPRARLRMGRERCSSERRGADLR